MTTLSSESKTSALILLLELATLAPVVTHHTHLLVANLATQARHLAAA